MNSTHTTNDGITYLRPEGDLDCESLRIQLSALFQEDRFRIVVDCCKVDYLDATVVHTMQRFAQQFAAHGGSLNITGLDSRLRVLFQMLGCGKLLATHTDAPTRPRAEEGT